MKTARNFSMVMTFIVAFLFIFSSNMVFAGEKEDFETAKQKSTLKNWELFLKKYPKGKLVKPARKEHDEVLFRSALKEKTDPKRLESLFGQAKTPDYADKIFALWEEAAWEKAETSGSTREYWQYVLRFPGGKHIKEAKSKIDQLDWAGCKEGADKGKCREYLSKHPRGRYAKSAKKKLADIEFQAVRKKDTIEAYRQFLRSNRNHTEARARLNQLLYIKAEKSGKAKDWKEYKNSLRGRGAIQKRAEARKKIAQIEFEEAKKKDTIAAYEKFLLTNPYHKEANIRAIHLRYQRAVQSGTLEDWLAFHDKGKFYRLRRFNRRRIRNNKRTRDKDIETINQMRQNAKVEIERLLYEKILTEPTLKLADDYLKRFPKGLHKQQVLAKKEPLMFQWAQDKKTILSYRKYLTQFPRGANAEQIRTNLDPLIFARAKKKDRLSSYQDYLRQFPNGKFAEQARIRNEWLKANPAVVEMTHPKSVRISSGFRWEWTTQFQEKSGKIGYEVRASGYIYDSKRRRWGVRWRGAFSARSISRGPVKVAPGGSGKHKYWIRGRQFCNGYASFTWRGKDASGRKIIKKEKVNLEHANCPKSTKKK